MVRSGEWLARSETQPAGVGKEERQSQTLDWACQRVRSAITYTVRVFVSENLNIHAVFPEDVSGQLRFLGSISLSVSISHPVDRGWRNGC